MASATTATSVAVAGTRRSWDAAIAAIRGDAGALKCRRGRWAHSAARGWQYGSRRCERRTGTVLAHRVWASWSSPCWASASSSSSSSTCATSMSSRSYSYSTLSDSTHSTCSRSGGSTLVGIDPYSSCEAFENVSIGSICGIGCRGGRATIRSRHTLGLLHLPPTEVPYFWAMASARRGAKILRWECDTLLAREMAAYEEAPDFLNFCLERADDFTRRDWLASLTLLTMRKRFSTTMPLFQRYSQRLLQETEVGDGKLDAASVHLLLHRYGVLNYAPAVWRLLTPLVARIPLMTTKQLAISAWALGRTLVNDEVTWAAIGGVLRDRAEEFSMADLAMLAWACAAVDRAVPAEVVALKRAVRSHLLGKSVAEAGSHDLCMLFRAIARLTPEDRRFHGWLLLLLTEGMSSGELAFAAQGLTSVWATLAALRWKPDEDVLEILCEESRSLRLDHTFNQDMAAEMARSLMQLDVSDPRPTYQVVDFVARRGLSLRADALLTLVEFFAARGVTHEDAWKRLGVRTQQRGVDLRLADIDRLVAAFRRADKGNQRIYGMLQLFIGIREDHARYGAA
eukprot:TRINITY_DN29963_c0_g1_i1.p1 TRINITY_DN29963_c0_g1~~TRINITY_DN29963_c0_g1_i1.p1  ORF type:complete len:580 (-),score=88.07 TRINITY_DN29963_c0_g1_i1:171-1877(-)